MHAFLALFLESLYTLGAFGLAIYGFHALWLAWQSVRQRAVMRSVVCRDPISDVNSLPRVTVQLPIYNERHVIGRLIEACAQLDYPADRLQIQVLDDSTDQTTQLVRRYVRHWRQRGLDIRMIHRADRSGFKAGALAHALPYATGEFIAIFDADFEPPIDFLQRIIPHFVLPEGQSLGFIQTRWSHLNADYSPLTRSQALALDGHFVVEQVARQYAGYPFGFNGSAGVWRRACIEDPAVGGWQANTLCEDLDLSYRAQLAGWQPRYLNDLEVPAEIPPQLSAFKRQQFRWAKGSIQTLRKLGRPLWQSEWPRPARLAGIIHLSSYLLHPLLLLLLLVSLPLLVFDVTPAWPLTYLSLASVGPPLLYAVGQRQLHPTDWWRRWAYIGILTLLGFGLSFNNSIAVWQALRGREGQFLRTPKFHIESSADRWQTSTYRLPLDGVFLGESLLFIFGLLTALLAISQGKWWSALFLSLYVGGYGLMIGVGLWQSGAMMPGAAWRGKPSRLRLRWLQQVGEPRHTSSPSKPASELSFLPWSSKRTPNRAVSGSTRTERTG